jgi:hypothetical protein
MFDGIHCQYSEGLTIVTVWARPSFLRKCAAAVCPEMPAPKTTIFAIKDDFVLKYYVNPDKHA